MLDELAAMEAAGVVHGDVRLENVLITNEGDVHLPQPGLRGVVRPQEGIASLDLCDRRLQHLAPEPRQATARRPALPATSGPAAACGGTFSAAVRRREAAIRWLVCGRRRWVRFRTCINGWPTCPKR